MNKYNKITVGYVVQEYKEQNDKMVCSHQYFVAGDQVDREDKDGNKVDVDLTKEIYQPFDMVQPEEPSRFVLVENSYKTKTFIFWGLTFYQEYFALSVKFL